MRLRPAASSDLARLHGLWTLPDVRRYLFDDRVLPAEEAQELLRRSDSAFASRGYGLWLVQGHAEREAIGFAGLLEAGTDPPNLVVGLAPDYWHRGLAQEAARLVLAYAFDELGLGEVAADVDEPNVRSMALLVRLGFAFKKRGLVEGRPLLYYRMHAADWTGSQGDEADHR